ncbi:probable histidine kinase 1 [Typha latifolia]|uniref:probable histidine kinase 1 n=1 Tax=Typha latifolia TaxID=4733 RepID=UPI003C2EB183
MGDEHLGEADLDVLPSMWPKDIGDKARKQFNVEKPGTDQDMLEEVTIKEESTAVDFDCLWELTNYSEKGSSQLAYLIKHWEYKQANAARLLNEELDILRKQRIEVELKKLEVLEEHRFEEEKYVGAKRQISILDEVCDIWEALPSRKDDVLLYNQKLDIDAQYNTVTYWKQRALQLDKLLESSIHRAEALQKKLEEKIKNLETQSSPVEELSQILKRADNFLHFILQTAPIVIGHQDKELRYRFIYNHFPSLAEEDIIGKTDIEIFSGIGVKEIQDFKKEVLDRGLPAKRELTFDTPLFGAKTFLIYVEPVFSKAGDTIGVNYMGMDVTDQVEKREKMAKLGEEIAVQKAKESELNKTMHIQEETMRAKQMLATMSHEIRSPLSGVLSMAQVLASTNLDKEQHELLNVMLSSGDLVLQLINDILDLSKVESGAMKLEAVKFRPREVVKHVLQTAAASLKKELTLLGHVDNNVPIEVIGDVLRIRQILTNLISNAVKFTHKGKVGINLHVVSEQCPGCQSEFHEKLTVEISDFPSTRLLFKSSTTQSSSDRDTLYCPQCEEDLEQKSTIGKECLPDEGIEKHHKQHQTIVWLCCSVYDTGIGIPEKALPLLFKEYMQASDDHARKYGGTGLGLAICKQLVELMGGKLSVVSQEHCGSRFTFTLPCKVPLKRDPLSDHGEVSAVPDTETIADASASDLNGSFLFKPEKQCALITSGGFTDQSAEFLDSSKFDAFGACGLSEESNSFSSNDLTSRQGALADSASPICDAADCPGSVKKRNHEFQGTTNGFVMHSSFMLDSNKAQNISGSQCESFSSKGDCESDGKKSRLTSHALEHELIDNSSQRIPSSSSHKILLVDDNKINIMVAYSMLKKLGHRVDIVNNGLGAIRALQRCQYDLILMDVHMPVMDGMQATRLIRSFEEIGYWDASVLCGDEQVLTCSNFAAGGTDAGQKRKRIPIVAMTANTFAESAAECLANGMDSHLCKPVTFQNLKQCLQQYLPCQTL